MPGQQIPLDTPVLLPRVDPDSGISVYGKLVTIRQSHDIRVLLAIRPTIL